MNFGGTKRRLDHVLIAFVSVNIVDHDLEGVQTKLGAIVDEIGLQIDLALVLELGRLVLGHKKLGTSAEQNKLVQTECGVSISELKVVVVAIQTKNVSLLLETRLGPVCLASFHHVLA